MRIVQHFPKQRPAVEEVLLSAQTKGFDFFEIKNTKLHHAAGNLIEKHRDLLLESFQTHLSQHRKIIFSICWGTATEVKTFEPTVKIFVEDFGKLDNLQDNTFYQIHKLKDDVKEGKAFNP
jgi:hypothetical protein